MFLLSGGELCFSCQGESFVSLVGESFLCKPEKGLFCRSNLAFLAAFWLVIIPRNGTNIGVWLIWAQIYYEAELIFPILIVVVTTAKLVE